MKKVIIYGAGVLGKKTAQLLGEKGVDIVAFYDSKKRGYIEGYNGKMIPILQKKSLSAQECKNAIICIRDTKENLRIADELIKKDYYILSVEQAMYGMDSVSSSRQYIADYHDECMEDYYANSENKDALDKFWNMDCIFKKKFEQLDLNRIVELGCGHGRHVECYKKDANEIVLVDILEKNIDFVKKDLKMKAR